MSQIQTLATRLDRTQQHPRTPARSEVGNGRTSRLERHAASVISGGGKRGVESDVSGSRDDYT